jgi:hypothetical protein
MNLTLTKQSGFTQIAQAALTTGTALAAASIQGINENAKFAAVRSEEFYGFYSNGTTVLLPVSPADGYAYARDELSYEASLYWSGGTGRGPWSGNAGANNNAVNFAIAGQTTPPFRGATGGSGQVIDISYSVNQATGVVTTAVTYAKDGTLTTLSVTTDGILHVTTLARRLR